MYEERNPFSINLYGPIYFYQSLLSQFRTTFRSQPLIQYEVFHFYNLQRHFSNRKKAFYAFGER